MNGGKDIKLGDDKRPVSFVPSNEQNLYNIRSGELLLDEYGNPLITEVDTYFLPDASMARSTSINFTDENTPYVEEDFKYIGTAAGVGAHYGNLDVHLDDPNVSTGNTVEVLQVSGAKIGVGTTAGTVPSTDNITPVTWFNRAIQTGINTVTGTFTPMDGTLPSIYPNVRVVNDLGGEHSNMLHFDVGVVSEHGAKVGDFVTGAHIPPGTQISLLAHNSQAHLTNDLQYTSPIKEYGAVRIRRAETKIKTSDSVWKIQEQFKETSEVSSTLLGVQRAETQLSLFSNVSTYGIDPDEFEQFSWTAGRSHGSWETRANKTYGKRYSTKMTEEVNEGGIKIGTFTTPYSFPFGPNWDRVGYYDQSKFGSYKNFINMGNDLYTIFSDSTVAPYSSYPSDFKDNFLPSTMTSVVGDDVEYHAGITTSFAQIDTWTDTWIEVRRGGDGFQDPVDGKNLDFGRLMEIVNDYNTKKGTNLTNTRTRDNTRPGYNTDYQKFIQLQSRRVFRYQPGRISGFTFGVRSSEESRDGSRIEWGIGNPTDQYVFSVNKGNFSIIRRSTIPFNSEVLARNGLKLTDQKKVGTTGAITSGDPYDDADHWIIEIPSDNFNGDPLTGNGPSGYNLNIPNVTMYKIEFGWYGAIGARFYAYIPAGNGEARWVTLHTLVIENSLNQPCLQDSYFRLLYRINVTNTDSLKTPQYITKYGASYYIDGGDEGTVQMYSSTSGVKKITGISSESLLAIKPKDYIYNSLGVAIENKKLIIPTKLQVSSGALTQLKTVTCRACPGFGHVHTPGIGCTTNGRIIAAGDIIFTAGNTMQALNTAFFTEDDIGAKIIAPSINNAYIKDVSGTSGTAGQYLNATLEGYTGVNGPLGPRNVAGTSVPTLDQVTGITTNIVISSGVTTVTYPYDIRLSQFKGVVASDFALTGNKIEIQFINPLNYDSYSHWADFIIGLTDVKPNCTGTADANAEIVDWTRGTVTNSIVPKNDEIIGGRHTHQWESLDEKGVGQQESWAATNPPCYMGLDHRLPTVSSPAGGRCSLLIVEVEDPTYVDNVDYLEDRIVQSVTGGTGNGPVGTGGTQHYLRVKNANFPSLTYDGGQVAIKTVLSEIDPITGSNKIQIDVQNNIKYVGVTSTYYQTSGGIQDSYNYIEISEKLPTQYGTTGISVALRPVKASSPNDSSINNRRIYNYDPFPLYFIAKMQDKASINNISIKETIGDFTRTLNPLLYVLPNTNTEITNAGGNAVRGDAPTHFEEIERLSSAEIDIQNEQKIRDGYKVIDTVYVGANETQEIDLTPVFGPDRAVITPDNNNAEATFIIAKRIDNNAQSEIEASISFKEK